MAPTNGRTGYDTNRLVTSLGIARDVNTPSPIRRWVFMCGSMPIAIISQPDGAQGGECVTH